MWFITFQMFSWHIHWVIVFYALSEFHSYLDEVQSTLRVMILPIVVEENQTYESKFISIHFHYPKTFWKWLYHVITFENQHNLFLFILKLLQWYTNIHLLILFPLFYFTNIKCRVPQQYVFQIFRLPRTLQTSDKRKQDINVFRWYLTIVYYFKVHKLICRVLCSIVMRNIFEYVWGFSSHSRTYMEMSPLPVKGYKFWPILGNHGHWALRVHLLARGIL